ncbi:MAG: Gfo/Idh/MocA family oxidoreductase [Clostridia bacterium]|nr:Gfo/Idh/MocA family oxidoreductase [Clostridia bacterium]
MKKHLNVGIVGFGAMGKTHAYSIASLPYFYSPLEFTASVRGICTTSAEKTARICGDLGFARAYKDAQEMIADPEINVIDICTPNVTHFEIANAALDAGKSVLCEKPFTVSYAQAQALAAKAADQGLICGVVYNNRHLAAIMRAKQLIEEGALGRILSFSFHYRHDSDIDPARFVGWKQDATVCGAGTLFDLGSHAIDLCRHLCGEFASISGKSHIAFDTHKQKDGSLWQTNADEAFYMTATLECGAVGQISVSKLAHGTEDGLSFEVYGTGGALRYSLAECDILYYMDASSPKLPLGGTSGFTAIPASGRYPAPGGAFPAVKAPQGWLRGHIHGMYLYLDAVASGTHFSPDFADGAQIQRIMAAAMKSDAEGGKEVQI